MRLVFSRMERGFAKSLGDVATPMIFFVWCLIDNRNPFQEIECFSRFVPSVVAFAGVRLLLQLPLLSTARPSLESSSLVSCTGTRAANRVPLAWRNPFFFAFSCFF